MPGCHEGHMLLAQVVNACLGCATASTLCGAGDCHRNLSGVDYIQQASAAQIVNAQYLCFLCRCVSTGMLLHKLSITFIVHSMHRSHSQNCTCAASHNTISRCPASYIADVASLLPSCCQTFNHQHSNWQWVGQTTSHDCIRG